MLRSTEYRHYRNSVLFSLLLSVIVALFLLVYGKENSFLVINKYNGPAFDFVFRYWTYLGDAIIWIPLFLYIIFYKRQYLVPVIGGLIVCAILTQFFKKIIYPNDFRPIVVLGEKVRTIPGYFMNRLHSFPSDYTSTAFTLALLTSFIVKRNFWVYFFPVVAFFVGYSRVYLAQHFVTDVFAGMLIGIISSYFGLLMFEYYKQWQLSRKVKNQALIDKKPG